MNREPSQNVVYTDNDDCDTIGKDKSRKDLFDILNADLLFIRSILFVRLLTVSNFFVTEALHVAHIPHQLALLLKSIIRFKLRKCICVLFFRSLISNSIQSGAINYWILIQSDISHLLENELDYK